MTRRAVARKTSRYPRWALLKKRDPAARRLFVYAVRTTGVYCRPGCASRLPLFKNVRFFDGPQQAQAAGFRPCKRCRPDVTEQCHPAADAVRTACRLMATADRPPGLRALAEAVGYSPTHFQRLFKQLVGVSPKAYAMTLRVQRAASRLRDSASVTQALHAAGYNASSRFYKDAADMLGMTPSAARTGADGQTMRAAVTATAFGLAAIAATERGVCWIELGDNQRDLWRRLRQRFPHARLRRGDRRFESWVRRLVAHLRQPQQPLDLPLDVQGTVFQRQVWEALRAIPPGQTITYSELAARLRKPRAARAVASACAANPLAVAIPCHRVVRRDGQPGGYRWGPARKQRLLRAEQGS
jgi:AraC family transcriptional regulator, regulatory protein of adaptative response / methylated-DNA-[protein]-cysteine methyltransferase